MRICFIDRANWGFDVSTPLLRPLGGSQSALCYLAVELAKLGHHVAVATSVAKPPIEVMGVVCGGLNQILDAPSPAYDSIIVLNSPGHGSPLRDVVASSTRLVLWTQHDTNQQVMRERLGSPEHRDAWDAIVCVSDWQRNKVVETFGIEPARVKVLRNAIAPSFENLFASHADLVAAKDSDVLRLAYTSTPFRGLRLLPDIFSQYHAVNPDALLEVYSSMAVYMESEADDRAKFGSMYDAISSTEGAEMVGSLPQPELAQRLRRSHILAYTNAFPETSCIAVMEAMAAGMRIVTSDLGALPETCEGFARLVPIDLEIDDIARSIAVKNASAYSNGFLQNLAAATYTTAGLYEQAVHMNQHHTWAIRARQWEEFLNAS